MFPQINWRFYILYHIYTISDRCHSNMEIKPNRLSVLHYNKFTSWFSYRIAIITQWFQKWCDAWDKVFKNGPSKICGRQPFKIWGVVSAWVLIPPSKPNPGILSVPPGTEKLNKSPKKKKSPDNSNVLDMFNNNTHTDFRTASKHVLIPSYVIQVI